MVCHAPFPKLHLLKFIILVEKQHLGIFEQSGIGNECSRVNQNHFLSSTVCISVKVSKLEKLTAPTF